MTDATGRPEGPWPGSGDARPRGGRVRRTGIALVRRGEMVVPFEGSEAELALAEQDARHDIHVHLPVVVEVVGAPQAMWCARRSTRHCAGCGRPWTPMRRG